MSVATAVEPLRAANLLSERPLYQSAFLSETGGFMPSSANGGFHTEPWGQAPHDFDLIFVAAGGNPMIYDNPGLLRYLRNLAARGVILGGISGGSAILARYGMMDGRRFTVHWQHVQALRDFYPHLLVERSLYVIDRDRYTCAGGVAALDMMHAMIASEHGAGFATNVSDWFIHTDIRTSSDPQQSSLEQQYGITHPALVAAIGLMNTHLADPLTPQQLGTLSGQSARNLQRLFNQQLGEPMMQFYRHLRLEKANELLQQSALPIAQIALTTGFGNAAHFSRSFAARFGVTPAQRRAQGLTSPTVRFLRME
ncbi:MAG: GlxA family transcriptional regulator [Alcaligenaceae bacterium]|nr:GlxA family transcriptional regulator [Alcaligenaceae bacterium]